MTAPRLHHTGLGYEYVRCRALGSDDTCYIHRLTIIAEHGVDALDPDQQVHHLNSIPWDNRPANLQVVEVEDHAEHHLYGAGWGAVGGQQSDDVDRDPQLA